MAKTTFELALSVVLRHEGGYSDHPLDPGGATMMGVTQATLAAWRGRPVSKAEVQALSRQDVANIYRSHYWEAIHGDELPPGLDLAVFDFAVNSGPSRAIKTFQQVLGVPSDGRIGPVTLTAMGRRSAADLARGLCEARQRFLEGLPTYPTFGRGWRRRVTEILKISLGLCEQSAAQVLEINATKRSTESMDMELTKSLFSSKTIWSNAIGLVALMLSMFGFNTSLIDSQALADQILQAIAAISFVLSTFFRVVATRKLA